MEHTVTATARTDKGSSVNRRLRNGGRVPGVVYGVGEPRMISVDAAVLEKDLSHEAFHSSVLSLVLDGEKMAVLLRDFQSHPVNDKVLHVDFQAIAEDAEISMTVPVHFVNAEVSPGVKLNHGVFSVIVDELSIHCLPRDLPENISVDVSHLEINDNIHLSEIKAPAGVKFDALARGEDPPLASVLAPQKEEEVAEAPEEAAVEDAAQAEAPEQQPEGAAGSAD